MGTTMHPDQIETSPALVRALLRAQLPELADLPIAGRPLSGTDNAVYRLGEQYSARLPIIHWSVHNEARIRPWLPWLRDRLRIAVPVPMFYGEPDCGYPYPWTVYPWLAGEPLQHGCDDETVARDVAAFLNELRSLPPEGAPATGRSPHMMDQDVRAALAQLLPEDDPATLVRLWQRFMDSPAWDGAGAVWMHGDVAPGNLLVRDGRLAAAIDWAGLGAGDPASDLQVAWNLFAPGARAVFRKELDVDDMTWDRARARAFAQAAVQLPYYRSTYIALASQAQYVLAGILGEM